MIAHLIKGEAKEYHENLSRALARAYRLRPVTVNIDAHLTVKSPFDCVGSDLAEVENIVERFVRTYSPAPYALKGFGNFEDRVVYMDVEASSETQELVQSLQEELKALPWLEFRPHEMPIEFHATLAYPRTAEQSTEMVQKLIERGGKEFQGSIDSIAILKRGERRWETLKEYSLGASIMNDPLSTPRV